MKRNSMLQRVAAALALAVVAGATAYAQPKMEIVGGETHDWGKVAPGKLTAAVQLKNVGDAELNITNVQPACGCTAAPIDKNLLKPGEIGTINITLDVTSRSGAVDKTVTITSNDTEKPTRILHLKADVHRAITITPMQYMVINKGKVGVETAASPITIKNTSDAPFTIEVPQLSNGGNIAVRFDMKGARELKPGEEFVLQGYVTPKDPKNLFGTVTMKTSSKEMPSIDFPVSGTMDQAAVTTPPAAPQLTNTGTAPRK